MKSKILVSCLFLFILIATSCKKESVPGIVGRWVSIANYHEENGVFIWRQTNGYSQFITFDPNARFSTFIDIPTGGGTYAYDNRAAKINLNYEADRYGTTEMEVTLKIEELTNKRLVVAGFSSTGNLRNKTEYMRLD